MHFVFHGPCLVSRKARDFFFDPHPPAFVIAVALTAASLLCGAGCASGPSAQPADDGAATVEYTDGLGNHVRVPAHPQRVISLAPNVTETLFITGAADQLIGVTNQCDWPEQVKGKHRIGDLVNPNYEVILGARPDLIIASTAGNDRGAVMKLSALGLPVFVTAPRSVEGIFESVAQIGRLTGHAAEGDRVLDDMRRRLADVERRLEGLPRVRAFYVTWFDPLLAPGKDTFENDVLKLAGVDSISSDVPEFYPRFSLEQVLARDPDVILTARHSGKTMPELAHITGWQRLRAVRNGRVYLVSEVLQHPSPRFVDGVEELARTLHPERFR